VIAFATCRDLPEGWPDDREAARLAGAEFVAWDDPEVDWEAYDRVVIRSVWDYSHRVEEFLAWCERVGPERLANPPALVAFDADKRYLGELRARTAPTTFVEPGDPPPELAGEVVVKPNVSAGARDTGRFGPARHAEARALIERIQASGRTAIVQAYLADVDRSGETALVYIAGELSHVLRKRAVLRGEGEAPLADGPLAPAAAMLEDDLVVAAAAEPAQVDFAAGVVAEVSERFGTPLYVRVDVAHDDDGLPVLMELEAIEPCLYFDLVPGAAERFARAVLTAPTSALAPIDTSAVCSRKCRG
jgi:glutathione synthase/RimK-type ligase-like ATP-grasp enzyme